MTWVWRDDDPAAFCESDVTRPKRARKKLLISKWSVCAFELGFRLMLALDSWADGSRVVGQVSSYAHTLSHPSNLMTFSAACLPASLPPSRNVCRIKCQLLIARPSRYWHHDASCHVACLRGYGRCDILWYIVWGFSAVGNSVLGANLTWLFLLLAIDNGLRRERERLIDKFPQEENVARKD